MLDDLGIDGMSSDEEERIDDGVQYRILVPRWRSPNLTPWLRQFDEIYLYYRHEKNSRDLRGTFPRRRLPSSVWSTSRKFVAGLPINAYRTDWLDAQLDIPNIVHPAPPITYSHDPDLAQQVFILRSFFSSRLTCFKAGLTQVPFLIYSIRLPLRLDRKGSRIAHVDFRCRFLLNRPITMSFTKVLNSICVQHTPLGRSPMRCRPPSDASKELLPGG